MQNGVNALLRKENDVVKEHLHLKASIYSQHHLCIIRTVSTIYQYLLNKNNVLESRVLKTACKQQILRNQLIMEIVTM